MSLYNDPNREVIYRILELLPNIDQALRHMQTQLEELRLEESAELFKNTAEKGQGDRNLVPGINFITGNTWVRCTAWE